LSTVNDATLAVAIVTPWYGSDLTGGAERTAWQMAHGLAERKHDVTVLTTCARTFASDWSVAAFREGTHRENGVTVQRYPVDPRDANVFDRANEVLLSQSPAFYARHAHAIGDETAETFVRHSINSESLLSALRDDAERFDAVIVLPYPYGLCLGAVTAVAEHVILVPCLHDETYAYLPAVETAFRAAGALAFNTVGERRLAYRIFGPAIALKSIVVGQWVDGQPETARPGGRVNGFAARAHRYVLYAGRRDETKNVDMLVESFATFRRRERMSGLELVLIGPGRRSYADPRHGVVDLGEVDDVHKRALLEDAWALVQPSVNESFSRVAVEAWMVSTPVAVNARCEATAEVVRESGGGWMAATKAQWSALFHDLDRMTDADREAAGARGRRYVEEQTSRERVLDRLENAILAVRSRREPTRFDTAPEPALLRRLRDGRRTVLFAGPLVETSCIEQLLMGFAHLLSFGVDARLMLVGSFDPDETLSERFFELVAGSGLGDRVLIFETANPEIVAACYRSADLFWSMAEDGPAAELVDAFGYGVPVFAFANERSRDVLETSGLLFNDKREARALAGVAAMILTDWSVADTLVDGQRRRFESLCRLGERHLAG
jgi:glycosyltransferase involved in cell wall biosynthesis